MVQISCKSTKATYVYAFYTNKYAQYYTMLYILENRNTFYYIYLSNKKKYVTFVAILITLFQYESII